MRRRFPRVRSLWSEWFLEAAAWFLVSAAGALAEHLIAASWKAARKAIKRWRRSRRRKNDTA